MHRQRTKLAKRVNRVASAVERRGIVATYQLHDRLLGNRSARGSFASHAPELDETQRGLVEALDRDGYVTLPFTELVGEETWKGIEAQGAAFVAETERTIAEGGSGKVRAGKEFVVRAHSFEGVTLAADDPWFSFVRLAPHARRRERLPPPLGEALVRRPLVHGAAAGDRRARRVAELARRLRRQAPPEGVRLPLGRRRRPRAVRVRARAASPAGGTTTVRPWVPMGYGRVDGRRTSRGACRPRRSRRFTGPKGTLILCNTSGLHRGGFATAGPRVLATATYCSPASLKALSNRNYDDAARRRPTDPVVRYAVS